MSRSSFQHTSDGGVLVAGLHFRHLKLPRYDSCSYIFFISTTTDPCDQAFEAPSLSQCNSNSTVKDLAKSVGDVKIRYGVIATGVANGGSDGPGAKKLAFANPQEVCQPVDKLRFDV